jgi:hypothetical protein
MLLLPVFSKSEHRGSSTPVELAVDTVICDDDYQQHGIFNPFPLLANTRGMFFYGGNKRRWNVFIPHSQTAKQFD